MVRRMQKSRVTAASMGWNLDIQAKANDLAFRLKATKAFPPPARNFLFQFSLRLHLSSLVIHVKSKPKTSIWRSPHKFFESKFAKLIHKFHIRFPASNRRAIAAAASRRTFNITPPPRWKAITIKGWDYCAGSSAALLQNLALLWQWISQKDHNGMVLVVNVSGSGPISTSLGYLASVVENNVGFGGKLSILLLLLLMLAATFRFSPSNLHCLFLHVWDEMQALFQHMWYLR